VSASGFDYLKKAREVMARKRIQGAALETSRLRASNGRMAVPAATAILHRA
jgi:hypothetical protein